MSASSRCCFVVEARLLRNGATWWDPRQSFPRDHWDESLQVFGKITVLARTQPTEASPDAAITFPEEVRVGEFPYYIGPTSAARRLPALILAGRQWARREKAFILRIPGFVPSLVWCWLRRYRKGYAVEVLGDPNQVFQVIRHPLRRLWRSLYSRAQRAMIRHATAAMYVSKTLAQLYPSPPGRPAVVVSDVRLTDEVFARPRTFPTAPKPIRLVHVGNMEQPYKGHEYLLKSIAICKQNGVAVKATLVGEGRQRPAFEEMSRQLGLEREVGFKGAVAWGPLLFELLDAADLFVMCSLTEGLPKALLEAMARGLPAVGSRVGGIPELLSAEVLVPPADERRLAEKIMSLARDPEGLTRLSARNFEEASRYRHELLSRLRVEFYHKCKAAFEHMDSHRDPMLPIRHRIPT
jgi:glycosyltransferase involved in cell wall biosynthesis